MKTLIEKVEAISHPPQANEWLGTTGWHEAKATIIGLIREHESTRTASVHSSGQSDDSREAFEKWYVERNVAMCVGTEGRWKHSAHCHDSWVAWRAAWIERQAEIGSLRAAVADLRLHPLSSTERANTTPASVPDDVVERVARAVANCLSPASMGLSGATYRGVAKAVLAAIDYPVLVAEIEALKHDIERYVRIASEEAERATLTAEQQEKLRQVREALLYWKFLAETPELKDWFDARKSWGDPPNCYMIGMDAIALLDTLIQQPKGDGHD